MRNLLVPILALGMTVSGSAFAQTWPSPSPQPATTNSQSGPQTNAINSKQLVTVQKLKQDLEKAGFTNVNVVAESFVVQAKSKDGDPV